MHLNPRSFILVTEVQNFTKIKFILGISDQSWNWPHFLYPAILTTSVWSWCPFNAHSKQQNYTHNDAPQKRRQHHRDVIHCPCYVGTILWRHLILPVNELTAKEKQANSNVMSWILCKYPAWPWTGSQNYHHLYPLSHTQNICKQFPISFKISLKCWSFPWLKHLVML